MNKKKILRGQPVALLFLSRLSLTLQSAEERINLDRLSIALNVIAKILLPNRSKNVDKLHLLKNAFRPLEKQQWHSSLNNVAQLKDNDFVISTKIISERIYG